MSFSGIISSLWAIVQSLTVTMNLLPYSRCEELGLALPFEGHVSLWKLLFTQLFGCPKQWQRRRCCCPCEGRRLQDPYPCQVSYAVFRYRALSPWQQVVWQLSSQGLRHNIALETRGGTADCLPADSPSEPEQTALWPAITEKGCLTQPQLSALLNASLGSQHLCSHGGLGTNHSLASAPVTVDLQLRLRGSVSPLAKVEVATGSSRVHGRPCDSKISGVQDLKCH